MDTFVTYWDRLITAWNPCPREDDDVSLIGAHPCSLRLEELQHTKQELGDLINWVERHIRCMPGYCQVYRKNPTSGKKEATCRFDYPIPCRERAGMGFDSKGRVRFEPRRNDPLLNSHNRAMIMAWRANIDIKPVLSEQAALSYIAKYASKAESSTATFPDLLASVVEHMPPGHNAQSACQKLLNKMLGERTYSAQETAHLLLGIPLVRTSVSFQSLNLSKDGSLRALMDAGDDADQAMTRESWIQR